MQQVALGEGWQPARATRLLRQAVAFEPHYYYYYRMHANFLLPKWYGEEGDSERFAAMSADDVGGEAGDILYFQIAGQLVCNCDDPQFNHMLWPRIQRGYAALEKQSQSIVNENLFASMAVQSNDGDVANETFRRIGDNWDLKVWKSERYFQKCRAWAAQIAQSDRLFQAGERQAAANVQTPEGLKYKKAFDQVFSELTHSCIKTAGNDYQPFEILVKVTRDNTMPTLMTSGETNISKCLLAQFFQAAKAGKALLPPAPHPDFWIKADIDPSAYDIGMN
jgi:hypothetical protein